MMEFSRIRGSCAERHYGNKIGPLPQPWRYDYDRPQLHHLGGNEAGTVVAENNLAW